MKNMFFRKVMSVFTVVALVATYSGVGAIPARAVSVDDSCVETTTTIVSDETNTVIGGGNAVNTYQSPLWVAIPGANWIWNAAEVTPVSAQFGENETFYKTFSVPGTITSASLEFAVDDGYSVDVNGTVVASGSVETLHFLSTQTIDVTSAITSGSNQIAFSAENAASETNDPQVNPSGIIYKLIVVSQDCEDTDPQTATVLATKIVCDDESDLPNWGAGDSVSTITATTAADFLATHPNCEESEWNFAWSHDGVGNPGDQTTGLPENWDMFLGSTEDTIPGGERVWFRENIQNGYIPFTGENTDQNVSAEIYCGSDVLNYDNWEFIDTVAGENYYCVAFNVPTERPYSCNPDENLIANGSFEIPNVSAGTYSIVPDINEDISSALEWLVAWSTPQTGGLLGLEIQDHVAGDPATGSGDQFAELDGDHPVTIAQTIATQPGETYTLSFKYSPRAGRDANDNMIEVKADGSVLGAALAVDGTPYANTVWDTYTRTFVADDVSTTIEFADTGTDTSFGGYLDDVRLSCDEVVTEDPTTITVTKVVVGNEQYDASDFPLFVGETGVVSGVATEFDPGTYTVYESSTADFTPTFSGDCVADESNESSTNLVSDLQAKKEALQNAIDASPEDTEGNIIKEAHIVDIDLKIEALQNSMSATITVAEGESANCTITNTYEVVQCEEVAHTETVVSDTTTTVDGSDSVALAFIHSAWTAAIDGATWIWNEEPLADAAGETSTTFEKTFTVVDTPTSATLEIAADNTYEVSLNGTALCASVDADNFSNVDTCVIDGSMLIEGSNTLSISVTNLAVEGAVQESNPAGLLYKLSFESIETCEEPPVDMCPNLSGDPTEVPFGYYVDEETGNCVEDDAIDFCPNIEGFQEGMPEGYHRVEGDCVPVDTDNDTQCSDGVDNGDEEDSLADELDPGCHTDGNADNSESYDSSDNDESDAEIVVVDDTPNNGGGNGRSGSRGGSTPAGEVLGATTECGIYLNEYIMDGKPGNNPSEIVKLQTFLNQYMNAGLTVNGIYNPFTVNAVKAFQLQRLSPILKPWGINNATGHVYITTQWDINMIMCPSLNLPTPTNLVPYSQAGK